MSIPQPNPPALAAALINRNTGPNTYTATNNIQIDPTNRISNAYTTSGQPVPLTQIGLPRATSGNIVTTPTNIVTTPGNILNTSSNIATAPRYTVGNPVFLPNNSGSKVSYFANSNTYAPTTTATRVIN